MEWFECKVSYEKTDESGKVKKASESYLVDAVCFADAENKITEEVGLFIGGDFDVSAVKKEKINEIFRSENGDGFWFKIKVAFITLDEVSGAEKRTMVNIYQQSDNMFSVTNDLRKNLNGSMVDWEIKSVVETKILNVYDTNNKTKEQ